MVDQVVVAEVHHNMVLDVMVLEFNQLNQVTQALMDLETMVEQDFQ